MFAFHTEVSATNSEANILDKTQSRDVDGWSQSDNEVRALWLCV